MHVAGMQYFNFGLIVICVISVSTPFFYTKSFLILPNTALAALAAFAHCFPGFRVLSTITPKSLTSSTIHRLVES